MGVVRPVMMRREKAGHPGKARRFGWMSGLLHV